LNKNWTTEQLKSAIDDVDKKMSIRTSCQNNGIPSSRIRGHVYRTTIQRKRGKVGVLIYQQEEELVGYLPYKNAKLSYSI